MLVAVGQALAAHAFSGCLRGVQRVGGKCPPYELAVFMHISHRVA